MIESCSLPVLGNPIIKSIVTTSHFHSGIGKGCSNPGWVSMLSFKFLAFHTSSDVFSDLSFHTWPKVMALDHCHGFLISRVPYIRNIMHFMKNHMFQVLRHLEQNFYSCAAVFHLVPNYNYPPCVASYLGVALLPIHLYCRSAFAASRIFLLILV
jgi:hypothetical protein